MKKISGEHTPLNINTTMNIIKKRRIFNTTAECEDKSMGTFSMTDDASSKRAV